MLRKPMSHLQARGAFADCRSRRSLLAALLLAFAAWLLIYKRHGTILVRKGTARFSDESLFLFEKYKVGYDIGSRRTFRTISHIVNRLASHAFAPTNSTYSTRRTEEAAKMLSIADITVSASDVSLLLIASFVVYVGTPLPFHVSLAKWKFSM
jgi:hypothetical protein